MSGAHFSADEAWTNFPELLSAFEEEGEEEGAVEQKQRALAGALAHFSPREVFTVCASAADGAGPGARLKISELLSAALPQIERKRQLFLKDGVKVHLDCFASHLFPSSLQAESDAAVLTAVEALCNFIGVYFEAQESSPCMLAESLCREEEEAVALLTKVVGENIVRRQEEIFMVAMKEVVTTVLKVPRFQNSSFQLLYHHARMCFMRKEEEEDSQYDGVFDEISEEEDSEAENSRPVIYSNAGVAAIMMYSLSGKGERDRFDIVDLGYSVEIQIPLILALLQDRVSQVASLRGIVYADLVFGVFGRQVISRDVFKDFGEVEGVFQAILTLAITYPDNSNRTYALYKLYSLLDQYAPGERVEILAKLSAACVYDHLAALLIDRMRKEYLSVMDTSALFRKRMFEIIVEKLYSIDLENILSALSLTSSLLICCRLLLYQKSSSSLLENSESLRTLLPVLHSRLSSALVERERVRKEIVEGEEECSAEFASLRPKHEALGSSNATGEVLLKSDPFPVPPEYGNRGHPTQDTRTQQREVETDILKLNLAVNALEEVESLLGNKVNGNEHK